MGQGHQKQQGEDQAQLKELWSYAEQVAKEELENNEPESFEEIDAEKVTQTIEQDR